MVLGWITAMVIACFVAYYHGTLIDKVGVFLSVLGMCVPFLAYMIIGQYLTQLREIAAKLGCPIITGATPNKTRESLYDEFRQGSLTTLVVSKVANFAVDLPEAHVAIQISGTFGSRQEEAQRLGRILRPKSDGAVAHFYTLVTRESNEAEFAQKRQLFLTEQGYKYVLESADAYVPDLAA